MRTRVCQPPPCPQNWACTWNQARPRQRRVWRPVYGLPLYMSRLQLQLLQSLLIPVGVRRAQRCGARLNKANDPARVHAYVCN